jgi:hypothetical protein
MLTLVTKSLTHNSPSSPRAGKGSLQGCIFETMEPEIDPEEESLCRPPLNARNGDWCPVVGPPDLFVSCYSNPIHATLELVRWPKRKLYFKSVRNAPQLMATREELTEKDSIKDENRHTTDTIELQERALTLYKE